MGNIYSWLGLTIAFLLLASFLVLKSRDNTIRIDEEHTFGDDHLKVNYNDEILRDKIRHKNIAFYAYLASLVISFSLGCWALFKIINKELDWKLLKDALSISAGTVSTISFKRLYDKCSRQVDALHRAMNRR